MVGFIGELFLAIVSGALSGGIVSHLLNRRQRRNDWLRDCRLYAAEARRIWKEYYHKLYQGGFIDPDIELLQREMDDLATELGRHQSRTPRTIDDSLPLTLLQNRCRQLANPPDDTDDLDTFYRIIGEGENVHNKEEEPTSVSELANQLERYADDRLSHRFEVRLSSMRE